MEMKDQQDVEQQGTVQDIPELSAEKIADLTPEEVEVKLEQNTANNPDTLLVERRRTKVSVTWKEWLAYGDFPSSVAIFTISTVGATIVACTGLSQETSQSECVPLVSLILGSGVTAQVIDSYKKRNK
ncbi:hypothetical protein [Leptothoe spongobia]|uniref:Uncharacterized protein n=1 Tax=Leptothoe spongobia TAU-MAC 1115 TaxID=1967444 RepID=A0A947DJG2_9CYAN|nr:hypothetical protein [Leptothoe spongobia]MBT9317748.1 hypothetical protein [Leptothoe spongobia TAU-MAC 1115]